jgi:hypothetical protein
LKFGSQLAASPTDLSKHIALYGTDRGINVDNSANLGIVSSSAITFNISGSAVGYIDSTGLNNMEIGNTYQHPGTFTQVKVGGTTGPTWTTGSAAPAATAPVGSLYSRTGGAVGATLYVSRGAGTWAAVAGV